MKEQYNLNELAMITSLTTRTLRNHLRQGTLTGEKVDGAWTFTSEDISAFLSKPAIRQSIESHHNAVVLDFLADGFKAQSRACVIFDYAVDQAESEEISRFYCDCVNRSVSDVDLCVSMNRGITRVILSGGEDQVMDILNQYYSR